MRMITEREMCNIFEKGFQQRKKIDEIWFHEVCLYILNELIELERNTWDKDRVQKLRNYIKAKEKTFGEFTTGGGNK